MKDRTFETARQDAHLFQCTQARVRHGSRNIEASEQTRFDALYRQHLRALKLQGKAEATVDGCARAVRRAAAYFDRCPDQLTSAHPLAQCH